MSEWRRIATQPLDGSIVLLCMRNGERCLAPSRRMEATPEELPEGASFDAGWTATHWMPVPAPPSESERCERIH
jgi:hypothetical protein